MSPPALAWTIAQVLIAALAAGLVLRAPVQHGSPALVGYRAIALAACCWAAGGVAQAVFGGPTGGPAPFLAADMISLAALPALVLGVAALTAADRGAWPAAATEADVGRSPHADGRPVAGTWRTRVAIIDGCLLVAAVFVITWVTTFGPAYGSAGVGPGSFALGLIRPVADLAAVGLLLPLAIRRPHAALLPVLALIAATIGDCLAVSARVTGSAIPAGSWLAWLCCLVLLAGFGALVAKPGQAWLARRSQHPPGRHWRPGSACDPATMTALAAAAAAAVVVTGYSLGGGSVTAPTLAICGAVVVLLLVLRVIALIRQQTAVAVAARDSDRMFLALAGTTSDAVLICDLAGVAEYVSPAVADFGYAAGQVVGRRLVDLVHPQDRLAAVRAALAVQVPRAGRASGAADDRGAGARQGQSEAAAPAATAALAATAAPAATVGHVQAAAWFAARVRSADGSWRHVECTLSCYRRPATAHAGRAAPAAAATGKLLVTVRDVSDRIALRRELEHLTYHDGLTGLPNRAFVEQRVRALRARAGPDRVPGPIGVILVDLDRYAAVNDLIGHGAGDLVLAQAGRRLRAAVPQDATVARWGGDEFAILLIGDGAADIQELAERLTAQIAAEPFSAAGRQIPLTASVGVALTSARRPGELLNDADIALSRAKKRGGGQVAVFSEQMRTDAQHQLDLAASLREAISGQQLEIDYQPVAELADGRVVAVQALARWCRDGRQVPPADLIAVAESSGLITPLGEWLLRQACRQVAAWRADSRRPGLHVAASARQVSVPGFAASVLGAVRSAALEPGAVTLEVTEEVVVDSAAPVVNELTSLRAEGVRLAITGVGAGYASLSHLPQLAADLIKIDPSLVAGLGTDPAMTLLTRTVVQVGHDLGVAVAADGIERPQQAELLRQMGCELGQGPAVARPAPAAEIEAMLVPSAASRHRQLAAGRRSGLQPR